MNRNEKIIYAGTYTKKESEGIYRFLFEEGNLSSSSLFCRIEDPKYLCAYEDKIVCVNKAEEKGAVTLIDRSGTILDQKIFEEVPSSYVACKDNKIYTANYHMGTFSVIDIRDDHFEEVKTIFIREKAGSHQVLFHKGKILIPCLFLDKVMVYDEDLHKLHEHVAIQINDTHPSMVIPELIRLLQLEKFRHKNLKRKILI